MENTELQNWSWFGLNFEWIGLGAAIIILFLLFGTSLLRGKSSISKWRDYTWLSWLGNAAYLLHNVEEYGIDLFGRFNAFPITTCTIIQRVIPGGKCPDELLYLAVNIPAFWVMAPIAALISKRHPFAGLSVYCIIFINSFAHLVPLVVGERIAKPLINHPLKWSIFKVTFVQDIPQSKSSKNTYFNDLVVYTSHRTFPALR